MKINNIFFLLFCTLLFSCNSANKTETTQTNISEYEVLVAYLEQHGDYINSPLVPSLIEASDVYKNLENNILVIDIRDKDSFNAGHIKGAKNVLPDSLLSFFDHVIEPNSYDTIVFVCDIGVRSSFVTGIFRLLGYNNVYSLKSGMCSWHKQYADVLWLKALSSHMESELEVASNNKPEKKYQPILNTGKLKPYDILRKRVEDILSTPLKNFFISIEDFEKNPEKYFVVKYWSEKYNTLPQLKGAYQFTPRQALNSKNDLYVLPIDKPLLIYCNMGMHSSFVVAFLRILGYDAYSLKYGANGFMYNIMKENMPENTFTLQSVNNFPLETSLEIPQIEQTGEAIKVPVKGGC